MNPPLTAADPQAPWMTDKLYGGMSPESRRRSWEAARKRTVPKPAVPEWPSIDDAAFYGLAGEIVRTIEPHSEADPVALLVQVLAVAGNIIGGSPYYAVESDRHRGNLFSVLVGDSAKGRKGTSFGRVRAIVKLADETWCGDRIKSGLSSGEGLINEVRDPVQRFDRESQESVTIDPGVTDKRLLAIEPEFAGVLSVAERHGNTLSPLIRKAWDGEKLATLTKNSPLTATGAHISIIGHVTVDELRARITRTDLANGFANRFLFVLVRRSKELPFGGNLVEEKVIRLGEKLKSAVDLVKPVGAVAMTDTAKAKWSAVYSTLSAPQPGLLRAVTARAEAQVVRLALIYALLDGAEAIDLPHLEAGLAMWEHAEASAAFIFGSLLGDPVADEILRALQAAGRGMTRTEIARLFSSHRSGDRIGAALSLLHSKGKATFQSKETGGRPTEVWTTAIGGVDELRARGEAW